MKLLLALALSLSPISPEVWAGIGRIPVVRAPVGSVGQSVAGAAAPVPVNLGSQLSLPAPLLTNTMLSRQEVISRLGYDPQKQTYYQLGETRKKEHQEIVQLLPENAQTKVAKITNKEAAQNELFVRAVMRRFPLFSRELHAPNAVGYKERWPGGRHVVIMEDVKGHSNAQQWMRLTLRRKVAVGILAKVLGIYDLNPTNIIFTEDGEAHFIDFEWARRPTHPHKIFSEMPWVSSNHLNDYKDYEAAVNEWTEEFKRPETQAALAGILRDIGLSEKETARDLALLADNTEKLESTLRADIKAANEAFLQKGLREGMSEEDMLELSRLNRSGAFDDFGLADIRLVREAIRINKDAVSMPGRFDAVIEVHEWKVFKHAYPKGLDQGTIERLKRRVRPGLSWISNTGAVEQALKRLSSGR